MLRIFNSQSAFKTTINVIKEVLFVYFRGHVVLKVVIVKNKEDPFSMMTKEEQMEMISNEDGTLKEEAKRVAPFAGELLEVDEVSS